MGLALAACAPLEPITASGTFQDHLPARAPAPAGGCAVNITAVADARTSPEILGIVGRAVKAPSDTQAWLRSILQGLGSRGFQVGFAAAPEPEAINMQVRLDKAWLTGTATNKTANVVVHVRAERAGSAPLEADYRGALTVMNWASTAAELQRLADTAFAKALDEMTPPLKRLCPV
jgi:hypothetical protein